MGKFRLKHAEALINFAQTTIGIKEGVEGLAIDIKHILMQLEMVDGLVAEIES
jgi:hypothetical protein